MATVEDARIGAQQNYKNTFRTQYKYSSACPSIVFPRVQLDSSSASSAALSLSLPLVPNREERDRDRKLLTSGVREMRRSLVCRVRGPGPWALGPNGQCALASKTGNPVCLRLEESIDEIEFFPFSAVSASSRLCSPPSFPLCSSPSSTNSFWCDLSCILPKFLL